MEEKTNKPSVSLLIQCFVSADVNNVKSWNLNTYILTLSLLIYSILAKILYVSILPTVCKYESASDCPSQINYGK